MLAEAAAGLTARTLLTHTGGHAVTCCSIWVRSYEVATDNSIYTTEKMQLGNKYAKMYGVMIYRHTTILTSTVML